MYKVCIGCDTEKELSTAFYHRDKSRKDGFREKCKTCRTNRTHNQIVNGHKECHECKESLPISSFHTIKRKDSIGYRSTCKECRNTKNKEYGKNYRALPETKEKRRLYQETKRENDPSFKIRQNLSRRINSALHGKSKSLSTLELTGLSIAELKDHLESLFAAGMSWSNYGEWHIDHIKPCALFNLEDAAQQKECFHYSNLQPLWAKDNLSKGDKYVA